MANWGFLGSIFSSLFSRNFVGGNKYLASRFRRNCIRCFFSLLGVLIFGYLLMKVYEVPVYYTKIDLVLNNCQPTSTGNLKINIVRDYDRGDKSSVIPDSTNLELSTGGIVIEGQFKPYYYMSNDKPDRIKAIKQIVEDNMKLYGREVIANPQMVYSSIQTSYRQTIIPSRRSVKEWSKSYTNRDVTFTLKNGKKIKQSVDDYYNYVKMYSAPDDNGCIIDEYVVASEKDSLFSLAGSYTTAAHRKPKVLWTAEDISKLVEVIELGHSRREKDQYSGAWAFTDSLTISYVGPAEFSENIIPEPDEKTLSYIRYTDKSKIEQIGRKGLRYHVKLPDMENIQEARIFILSGILTGIAALFVKYFWRILYELFIFAKFHITRKYKVKKWIWVVVLIIVIIVLYYTVSAILNSNISPFDIKNSLME